MVRALLTSLVVCGLWCGVTPAPASAQTASSAEVKAAFLFNFSKFVAWPGTAPNGPFVLGVMSDARVAAALADIVRGKSVGGRPLTVKSVSAQDDLTTLHILFVGIAEKRHVDKILSQVNGSSVLTVSDLDRFCEAGGMIQFRTEDDRVRFDVNLLPSATAGLALNSKLLALARTVHSRKKP